MWTQNFRWGLFTPRFSVTGHCPAQYFLAADGRKSFCPGLVLVLELISFNFVPAVHLSEICPLAARRLACTLLLSCNACAATRDIVADSTELAKIMELSRHLHDLNGCAPGACVCRASAREQNMLLAYMPCPRRGLLRGLPRPACLSSSAQASCAVHPTSDRLSSRVDQDDWPTASLMPTEDELSPVAAEEKPPTTNAVYFLLLRHDQPMACALIFYTVDFKVPPGDDAARLFRMWTLVLDRRDTACSPRSASRLSSL